jgi:hypothetical protein
MERIIPENEPAYRVAYKVMYSKEFRKHDWKEIEREKERVFALNCVKPAGAKDIRTYGSRIADAVLKAVNETAEVVRRTEEGK